MLERVRRVARKTKPCTTQSSTYLHTIPDLELAYIRRSALGWICTYWFFLDTGFRTNYVWTIDTTSASLSNKLFSDFCRDTSTLLTKTKFLLLAKWEQNLGKLCSNFLQLWREKIQFLSTGCQYILKVNYYYLLHNDKSCFRY